AHDALALAYLVANRPDAALAHAEQAMSIYERQFVSDPIGSLDPLGYVLNMQGVIQLRLGLFELAVKPLQRGRELGRKLANTRLESFCRFNLARAFEMNGQRDEALSNADA